MKKASRISSTIPVIEGKNIMVQLVKSSTEFELSPTLAANEMVAKRRAEGKQVLHMGFGESPFPVPQRLQDSLKAGVDRKEYLPTGGLKELQDTVAKYYEDKIDLDTSKSASCSPHKCWSS